VSDDTDKAAREWAAKAGIREDRLEAAMNDFKAGASHALSRLQERAERAERERDQNAHMANEWADMATNGIQWLRNIRDGVSAPAVALAEMEENLTRIRALSPTPSERESTPRQQDKGEPG
jgi:hypothetical protein